MSAPESRDLGDRVSRLVEGFGEVADLISAEIDGPFIIREGADLRRLIQELAFDTELHGHHGVHRAGLPRPGFRVTGYASIRENEPMTLLNMAPDLLAISVLEGAVRDSEDGGH